MLMATSIPIRWSRHHRNVAQDQRKALASLSRRDDFPFRPPEERQSVLGHSASYDYGPSAHLRKANRLNPPEYGLYLAFAILLSHFSNSFLISAAADFGMRGNFFHFIRTLFMVPSRRNEL